MRTLKINLRHRGITFILAQAGAECGQVRGEDSDSGVARMGFITMTIEVFKDKVSAEAFHLEKIQRSSLTCFLIVDSMMISLLQKFSNLQEEEAHENPGMPTKINSLTAIPVVGEVLTRAIASLALTPRTRGRWFLHRKMNHWRVS